MLFGTNSTDPTVRLPPLILLLMSSPLLCPTVLVKESAGSPGIVLLLMCMYGAFLGSAKFLHVTLD